MTAETERAAARLTEAMKRALLTLPMPRAAYPVRLIAARSYGDLWRKASGHWDTMLAMEEMGLVERRVSRGETLWRPTKVLGLSVRAHIAKDEGE